MFKYFPAANLLRSSHIYFLLQVTRLISNYFSAEFAIIEILLLLFNETEISKDPQVWIVDRHALSIARRHIVPIAPSSDKFPEWVTAIDLFRKVKKGGAEGETKRDQEMRRKHGTRLIGTGIASFSRGAWKRGPRQGPSFLMPPAYSPCIVVKWI